MFVTTDLYRIIIDPEDEQFKFIKKKLSKDVKIEYIMGV